MATSTASRSALTSTPLHHTSVGKDLEPDETWKVNKQQEIENGFSGMIQDAKERLESKMQALTAARHSPEWEAQSKVHFDEFEAERNAIKALAKEEFLDSLARERVLRRLTTGGSVNATVNQSVLEEQEAIFAQIMKARRDSTSGPSQSPTIPSQAPAPGASGTRSAQHEPAYSPSSSSERSNVPGQEPRSKRSPEISRPPTNHYRPDPSPTESRTPSAPTVAHPAAATGAAFALRERTTTSAGGHDRWTPESVSPDKISGPTGNRRMSTNATMPGPFYGPSTSPISPRSEPVRKSTSPVQERTTPRSAPPPSHSPQTMSQTQDRVLPGPAPPPSRSPSHTMGPPPPPLQRQTSKTWQAATSPPPAQRPVSSSPRAQRSQNDHYFVPSSSEPRNEGWVGPQMTDEPEDEDEDEGDTDEEEQQPPPRSRYKPPVSVSPLMPRRDSVREKPIASSPPAPKAPPEVWTPPIRDEDSAQASRPGRERSGSSLRSARNGRKPIPQPFVDTSAPAPGPDSAPSGVDVKKYAEREAAERREYERSWENIDKSREKERAGSGPRLSTASEQLRQSDRVGSGIIRQAQGASTPARSPETHASYFPSAPSAAPSSYSPVNVSDNSSYHSTYSSGLNGMSTNHLSNVSSPYSPTTEEEEEGDGDSDDSDSDSDSEDEDEEEEEEDHRPATTANSRPSYPPEHKSNTGPSLAWMPPNRSSPYSSHSPAVPIPVPQRSRTPEDDPSVAYSAGEYSRYGTPQRERNSYNESFRGGSYSSRGEDAHLAERERWEREERERMREEMERERVREDAERERKRERERERVRDEMERERIREELELERERVQRVQEAGRAAKKLAEEAERKAEEIRLKEEATKKKEAELLRQQQETERKLREINQREADLREREEQMRQREEETKQKEAVRLREEAAKQREEAAKQREEAERQRKEKERRRAELDRQRLEAEQRFAFQQREAEEARLKEVARQKEEAEKQRKEKERQRAEADKRRFEAEQQFAFQQREAEIKRKADERRRQGSLDADSNWGGSTTWGTPPVTPARSNTTGSTWSSTSKASSTSSTTRPPSNATPNGKAPPPSPYSSSAGSQAGARPSTSSSKPTPKASTTNPPPANPDDWARRQREQAEEQFRKMQEQLERERQAKEQKAGRMLTKEDVVRIYQQHEQLWSKMSSHTEVTWDMLPWPMYKKPNSAEEITSGAVDAYIMSPHYPDQDKSTKDRVRQQLRRWHEDHFNQKVLSKVSEGDKERVKAAAGTVTRNLNNLLERANESKKAGSSVFG